MNQKSIFNKRVALAIVGAIFLFIFTQITCAYLERWALEGINESNATSDILQNNE